MQRTERSLASLAPHDPADVDACSCARCATTRRTPRCRATGCWCGRATSAGPRRASTPGCRWACGCCATSRRSSARRWTRSAPRSSSSPRCCPASPTRRPAAGRSTATASSGSRTARAATTCSGPRTRRCSRSSVKDLYSSYKDLPVWLYQIQTKYRDEARPRAGILRGREFIMKDSYSFDTSDEGLERRTPRTATPTSSTFDRLGFDYVIVKATSRARWAARSRRSSWPRPRSARTPTSAARNCDYAANVEAVQVRAARSLSRTTTRPRRTPSRRPTPRPSRRWSPTSTRSTPATTGPGHAGDTLKNVLVVLKHPDGTREPLAIGLPGDREVDQKRLEGQLEPTEVEPIDETEFAQAPVARQGLHRPRRAGGEERVRHPLPGRPPRSSRAPPG